MGDHLFLRQPFEADAVALGPKLFRKQILRFGEWKHPAAPGGKLQVTKEFVAKIIENFNKGLRDDVPIPKGHDVDALTSVGKVVGLEMGPDGLYGLHEIEEDAEKIGKTLTGTSAFINMDYEDAETGEHHGPVLIHNALTNAPYIKGLAPFEALALGEDAEEAVVIALPNATTEADMTLEELLAQIEETSDDELREALEKARPELFAGIEGDESKTDDDAIAAAKDEARKEVVAALAEKGITVALSEENEDEDPKVDVTGAPEFVALSERVDALETEKREKEAADIVEKAIKDGKVLPAQREGLMEVALSEGGMERVKKLIPEESVVDLSEHGVSTGHETNVELSEEDAEKEAARLVSTYASSGKKE